jgi:hypothetical protein
MMALRRGFSPSSSGVSPHRTQFICLPARLLPAPHKSIPSGLDSACAAIVSDATGAAIVRFVAGVTHEVPLDEIDAVPPLLSLLCAELNEHRAGPEERHYPLVHLALAQFEEDPRPPTGCAAIRSTGCPMIPSSNARRPKCFASSSSGVGTGVYRSRAQTR